jgi:hypothetical protein
MQNIKQICTFIYVQSLFPPLYTIDLIQTVGEEIFRPTG